MNIQTIDDHKQNHKGIEIKPRHPHFDATEQLATIWIDDEDEKLALFKTTLMNSLSILFPEGERMFIRSVKAFQDKVTDPKLLEEVKLFIEQEGQHTREHHKYNQALKQRGYDIDKLEKKLKKNIQRMARITTPEHRLAVTCALEHFTAVLGDTLLDNPQLHKNAHPKMQAIWKWHAVEEIEHKAVAFDVYKTTINDEKLRLATFRMICVRLPLDVFFHMCHMFRKEGKLLDYKMWYRGYKFLFNKKDGLFTMIRPKLREYYREDFHPWDENNSELVENWKKTYQDSNGNLHPSFL